MANLTITVDAELLKRARVRAAEDDTSVNAILRQELERYAGPSSGEAILAFLKRSREPLGASEPYVWSRGEIYRERHEKLAPGE